MFRTATPNIPQSWSTTSVAGDGLRDRGVTEVACLISTDDEAFTYNNRVNSIAIIQEHKMILKAIENGVSEERIAKSLMSMSQVSGAAGTPSKSLLTLRHWPPNTGRVSPRDYLMNSSR